MQIKIVGELGPKRDASGTYKLFKFRVLGKEIVDFQDLILGFLRTFGYRADILKETQRSPRIRTFKLRVYLTIVRERELSQQKLLERQVLVEVIVRHILLIWKKGQILTVPVTRGIVSRKKKEAFLLPIEPDDRAELVAFGHKDKTYIISRREFLFRLLRLKNPGVNDRDLCRLLTYATIDNTTWRIRISGGKH